VPIRKARLKREEERVRFRIEGSKGVDRKQPVRTRNRHRSLSVLVIVVTAAVLGLGACSTQETTTAPETAVSAEIEQLLDDYYAAFNAYDVQAVRALVTDGFMLYETGNRDPENGVSTGINLAFGLDRVLDYVAGSYQFNECQWERLGEPFMAGDGPWLVSQAYRYTAKDYEHPEAVGIAIYTIVDEEGTLKVARDISVGLWAE
jgi:hypothetical protein